MKEGIEHYKQYLGNRFNTLRYAFESFKTNAGQTIVELGTSRSFVSGGNEGCMSSDRKYWKPNDPSKWDWGAGIFTRMCAMHLQASRPEIHTVDCDPNAIEISKVISAEYRELITYHVVTSESFLKSFEGKIDFLYMDAGETQNGAAQLHLRESKIAIDRGLFSAKAIVLIDDVTIPGRKESKGTHSIPYLTAHHFKVQRLDYQAVLQRC